jgi:hypothetical protein
MSSCVSLVSEPVPEPLCPVAVILPSTPTNGVTVLDAMYCATYVNDAAEATDTLPLILPPADDAPVIEDPVVQLGTAVLGEDGVHVPTLNNCTVHPEGAYAVN